MSARDLKELSEVTIHKLETEINHYQYVALEASKKGNEKECQAALLKQQEASKNLISLLQTYGGIE